MTNRRIPRVRVFTTQSVQSLMDVLPFRRRYFTLLLAWDADPLEEHDLVPLFAPLVDRGLAYFCAWGHRCEEVHDAVDHSAARREALGGPFNYVTMTTWHSKVSLEDATWYFYHVAIPSEPHVLADFDRFAVAIGNPDWVRIIHRGRRAPKRSRLVSMPMTTFPLRYNKEKHPPPTRAQD